MSRITITTKGGDKGMTSLCNGERIPKDDPRVEAYGTIDECQAVIGLARSFCEIKPICDNLKRIEDDLYSLMGCMALCEDLLPPSTEWLEKLILDVTSKFEDREFKFVRPGENRVGAALHMSRTIARRAERQAVGLFRNGKIDSAIFKYINRLSDAIYSLILWHQEETS